MNALIVLLAFALAVLAVLVAGLLRSHAEILRELHDLRAQAPGGGGSVSAEPPVATRPGVALPRGEAGAAHDVVGVDPAGAAVSVGVAGAAQPTLLAFLSTGCLTCQHFWDELADPAALGLPAGVRLVVVTKGPANESPGAVARLASATVTVVMSDDAWDAYEVPVAPYFILIDGPGARVAGEGAAATWPQVRTLMRQAIDDLALLAPAPPEALRRRGGATGARDADADEHLLRAGIRPGDPSLYHDPNPAEGGDDDR